MSIYCFVLFFWLVVMVGSSRYSALAHIHCIDKTLPPRFRGVFTDDSLLGDASARLRSAFLFGCSGLSSKVFILILKYMNLQNLSYDLLLIL